MKKFTLVLLCAITATIASAQYGQRTYYLDSLSNESFAKGIISTLNPAAGLPTYAGTGTIMNATSNTGMRARFARAQWAGATAGNRMYIISNNGFETPARSNAIADDTSKFVLSGTVMSNPLGGGAFAGGADVLLMKTNSSGIPGVPYHVDIGQGFDEALCTKRSANNVKKFYTCGYTMLNNTERAFLMKHNVTGSTVNWVRYFSLSCINGLVANARATYLVEDPASGNICVVGTMQQNVTPGGCRSSFLAKFSSAGVLLWLHVYSFTAGSGVDFNSIKPTEIPNTYIITGTVGTPAPVSNRILLFRVAAGGAVPVTVFSNVLFSAGPSPNFPVQDQFGYDVITRTSAPNIEYYIAGMTTYTTGKTDGHVFKTTGGGTGIKTMLYGSVYDDRLSAIDWIDIPGSTVRGIADFGKFEYLAIAGTPPRDRSWLVKSYFNLVSGCNEIVDSPQHFSINLVNTLFQPNVLTAFTIDTLAVQYVNCFTKVLCWATVLAGGSNAKIPAAAEQIAGDKFTVFPNPLTGDAISIDIRSLVSETASVKIFDALGNVIDDFNVDLHEGINTLQADLTGAAKGWYIVQVTSSDGIYRSRFVKQ